MKTFFQTTPNLATFIIGMGVFFVIGQVIGQDFTSASNGKWNANTTWSSVTSCKANQNISQGHPPISKDWGCPVTVSINHYVVFDGTARGFGSGTFSMIELGSQGKLEFKGDLIIDGGGSVPEFIMAPGSELVVTGRFAIDRKVSIVIPNSAKLTVKELVIGDNQPNIIVEQGGILEVLEGTTLKSKATLNVNGDFDTNDLEFTSGGTVTIGSQSGRAVVKGDLFINNGELNLDGKGSILVDGKTSTGNNGSISLNGSSNGRFTGDVTMGNGGSLLARNSSEFTFGGNLSQSGGAKIELKNYAKGFITNDVTMTNGIIDLSNNTEIFVGGKLSASNGASLNGNNSAGFFICDYPNSTKEDTYHVSLKNTSFYGAGCFSLPVVWKSFTVSPGENVLNQLVWETAKEIASSHYEIERSIGGVQNFETIGEVTASGWTNTGSRYTYQDREIAGVQGMVYYRIRQVDFTENSTVSEVISVKVDNQSQDEIQWTAYPNPSDGSNLQVKVTSGFVSGPVSARFSHATASVSFEGEVGMALDQWLQQVIQKASKGVCVLELVYGEQVYRVKILKV
ncbi:hypothetical protein [Cyclobacterium jeungdonense]|uniref:Uncharacterized protein n=1 Tax=Cyclobacterium jeungdonense TaxID=708087 RepID=A0ABT8C5A5_9BACT|nr:hypothetical protein [Cyclobacterium jeungdonense]MDN3687939.1 hypothetical protein [Cyclobacterium jeungdonense]